MIKVETLQAFTSVADCQSFTAAANLQQQTPMAISKQISLLEKRLGQALFIRTTRRVNLTEFGEAFYQKALQLLTQHHDLDDWLEGQDEKVSGHISLCAQSGEIYSEMIYPWLDEFCQLYPELTLSFDIEEGVIDIHQQQCDLYWGVGDYLGEKFPGLKKRALWRSVYGIYAAPAYLSKYGTPTNIDELSHHQVIGYLHNQPNNVLIYKDSTSDKQTDSAFQHIIMESKVQAITGLTNLAKQGFGLINAAADQQDIIAAVDEGSLKPVLIDYWANAADISIYYHQSRYDQKKVRAFIDFFYDKKPQWSQQN